MKALYFILLIFVSSLAQARNWEKIVVPGALCGDGKPYQVFIDRKDQDKILIEFMKGGACWNEASCYGDQPLTNLHPLEKPLDSVINSSDSKNPWRNYSAVFFPYCTGDVHVGFHVASYKQGAMLYHHGFNNVVLTLQHLSQRGFFNFKDMQKATVWGASAGGIGALIHANTVEAFLGSHTKKVLISDSPGLHFGKNFWHKFSPEMNDDFAKSFSYIGLNFSPDDGFLAPRMGPAFVRYQQWSVGILQSTKDYMMSLVFGGITPANHERLVLGPEGLPAIARGYPHVATWIPLANTHTFLVRSVSADNKDPNGETAWDFANRVLRTAQ